MHEEIFHRLWVSKDNYKIEQHFFKYTISEFSRHFETLMKWDLYSDIPREVELYHINEKLLSDYSYQTHFTGMEYWKTLITVMKSNISSVYFYKSLAYIQILINLIYQNRKHLQKELSWYIESLQRYINDNPTIWFHIKTYKTRPPKFLPTISKESDKIIDVTLDILEQKQFKNTIESFSEWMKQYMNWTSKADWKNVIEDMHNSCDEIIKELTWKKSIWFQHVYKKDKFEQFWLNWTSKEIFKHLKIRMDDIKHWSNKEYWKQDAELMINLSISFIQHVAKSYTPDKK
jgi:hypothetical protein